MIARNSQGFENKLKVSYSPQEGHFQKDCNIFEVIFLEDYMPCLQNCYFKLSRVKSLIWWRENSKDLLNMIRKLKGLSDIFVKSSKGLKTMRILEGCQAQQNPNFNSAWLGLLYSSLGDSSTVWMPKWLMWKN